MGRNSSPGGGKIFILSTSSRPVLWPTQSPIQWVPRALLPGLGGRGVKVSTHLQLVPRSRMRGSTHQLHHTSSWCNAELVKQRENFIFTYSVQKCFSSRLLPKNVKIKICETIILAKIVLYSTASRPALASTEPLI
jgi:hypothetical protein